MMSNLFPQDERILLYQAGYSVSQVAAITNYSKSGVYYWLKANQIEMRPPGYSRDNDESDHNGTKPST